MKGLIGILIRLRLKPTWSTIIILVPVLALGIMIVYSITSILTAKFKSPVYWEFFLSPQTGICYEAIFSRSAYGYYAVSISPVDQLYCIDIVTNPSTE